MGCQLILVALVENANNAGNFGEQSQEGVIGQMICHDSDGGVHLLEVLTKLPHENLGAPVTPCCGTSLGDCGCVQGKHGPMEEGLG